MSRRSKGASSPISLFSFQDLITSLSGILILLVLMMSVQIAVQAVTATPPRMEDPEIQARLTALREDADALRKRLAELQARHDSQGTNDAVSIVRATVQAERKHDALQGAIEKSNSAVAALEKSLGQIRAKEAEARSQSAALTQEMEQLRAAQAEALEQNKIFVIPEEGTTKTAVIVECSDAIARAGYIDRAVQPVLFAAGLGMSAEFRKYLEGLSSTREYIVFMVKPSGVNVFQALRSIAMASGFDVGYDALEEDRSIALGSEAI